jgi:DNA-binding response OmpR family regulator
VSVALTAPRTRNVLVIDDEAALRTILRSMLEPDICRVVEAPDAETGLRFVEQDEPTIDAVLTDWIMPGLHGLDVVEVLDRYRPDLPVIVISAFTSTIHPIIRRGSRFRILQKPFTRPELQATVSALLLRARDTRTQAVEMRRLAAAAREHNAEVREQNEAQRARLDLVSAAWALHRSRGH